MGDQREDWQSIPICGLGSLQFFGGQKLKQEQKVLRFLLRQERREM
jgi:hypothetical protein